MRSDSRTHEACFIAALSFLLVVVEPKPAAINRVAGISASRCLSTPPHITAPPTSGHAELLKVKREDFGFDTCAYINAEPFTCAGSGTCTSLRSGSADYVGCCYGEGDCDIYTGCYDGDATAGTRASNPRILSCVGTKPFCATVLWPQEPKAAYICAEQPSTITVDSTTKPATPTIGFTSGTPHATEEPSASAEPSLPQASDEPEPTEPADEPAPTEPAEPTEPTEPTEPAEPTEPTEPTESTEPKSGPRPIADLTKGQKIGIGAGCGTAGLLFVAGLGYCCYCSEKRRQKIASKDASENGIVTVNEVSERKPHVMRSR